MHVVFLQQKHIANKVRIVKNKVESYQYFIKLILHRSETLNTSLAGDLFVVCNGGIT